MKRVAWWPLAPLFAVLLLGCGEEQAAPALQTQTEALDRAHQAVEMHETAAAAQRRAIDEQSR